MTKENKRYEIIDIFGALLWTTAAILFYYLKF